MDRSEYLQRPLIEGIIYEITSESVRIYNDNTSFLDVRNCRRITLEEVRRHFVELRHIAMTSEKLTLKGVTKFMPAVRSLYPAYCAACDDIERLFAEIHEMIPQMQKEGLHTGCMDDELLTCAMRKQHEIGKYYYRSNDYSRFLSYDKCLCEMLTNKPWKDDTIAHYTAIIA